MTSSIGQPGAYVPTTSSIAAAAPMPASSTAASAYAQVQANTAATPAPASAIDLAAQIDQLRQLLSSLVQALQGVRAAAAAHAASTPPALCDAVSSAAAVVARGSTPQPVVVPIAAVTAPSTAAASTGRIAITGGTAAEQQRLNAAIGALAKLPTGAGIVQRMQAANAHFSIDDDAAVSSQVGADSGAYFDPTDNTIHLRRSSLDSGDTQVLVYHIAHEGTHLVDQLSSDQRAFSAASAQQVASLGGRSTAAGARAEQQLMYDGSFITETNAYYEGAKIMQEMGMRPSDISGGVQQSALQIVGSTSDEQTAKKIIWNVIAGSAHYNPSGLDLPYRTYAG